MKPSVEHPLCASSALQTHHEAILDAVDGLGAVATMLVDWKIEDPGDVSALRYVMLTESRMHQMKIIDAQLLKDQLNHDSKYLQVNHISCTRAAIAKACDFNSDSLDINITQHFDILFAMTRHSFLYLGWLMDEFHKNKFTL